MNTHLTSLTVEGYTLTLEHYRAQSPEERRHLRRDICDRLCDAFKRQQDLIDAVRKEVEAQFAEELAAAGPRWLPGALTRSGKPDKRYADRRNPKWSTVHNRQESIIRDLCGKIPPTVSTFRFPYQFDQVTQAWEETLETPMEKLERLLGSMDWYACYSDDYSVCQAGEARMAAARSLVRQLGPEAQAKFNRACPWLNDDGTLKDAA